MLLNDDHVHHHDDNHDHDDDGSSYDYDDCPAPARRGHYHDDYNHDDDHDHDDDGSSTYHDHHPRAGSYRLEPATRSAATADDHHCAVRRGFLLLVVEVEGRN
jgi:hypothetical protein